MSKTLSARRNSMTRRARVGLVTLLLPLTACVLPADDATGLELSWRFVELNDADGPIEGDDDTSTTVRTCEGAEVRDVVLRVRDAADETRFGTFVYPCEEGFQTLEQFRTEASDAFIPLRSGPYVLDAEMVTLTGSTEFGVRREITVLGRSLTIDSFELARMPVDWTLELTGHEACAGISMRLLYADPRAQLGGRANDENDENDESGGDNDDDSGPVLYRRGLESDRGLSLGGTSTTCAEIAGAHLFRAVDPGAYRLEIVRDDASCGFFVTIDHETSSRVDLGQLPCG